MFVKGCCGVARGGLSAWLRVHGSYGYFAVECLVWVSFCWFGVLLLGLVCCFFHHFLRNMPSNPRVRPLS